MSDLKMLEDKLNNLLSDNKSAKKKIIDARNELAWEIRNVNRIRSIELADESIQISLAVPKYPEGAALGYCIKANADKYKNPAKALSIAKEVLQLNKTINDDDIAYRAANTFGVIYANLGNVEEGLRYYLEAMNISERIGKIVYKADTVLNLADLFSKTGNNRRAIEYTEQAYQLYETCEDHEGLCYAITNLAEFNLQENQIDQVRKYIGKFDQIKNAEMYPLLKLVINMIKGVLFVEDKEYDAALELYRDILEKHRHNPDSIVAEVAIRYTKILYDQKEFSMAAEAVAKATEIAENVDSLEFRKECKKLESEIYAVRGEYKKAYLLRKQYDALQKELSQINTEEKISNYKIMYETEQIKKISERFDLALEAAQTGLWDINPQTGDVYYSSQWFTMLGYTENELPHNHDTWSSLLHPDEFSKAIKEFETNIIHAKPGDKKFTNQEFRLRKKDGSYCWILSRGRVMEWKEDKPVRVVGTHIDITRIKYLSEELKIARDEAEAATKAKGDFLANMSHEIRTPMNAIIGLNHLLSRTEMSNKQKDYVNKVSHSATGLLGIINDILDFSKIEAGKMDIEKIDFELNDVFDNLLNLVGEKVRDKGLKLIIDTDKDVPPFINGDSLRIGQILINFVSNALKFTEKGEIKISCNLVSQENDSAVLKFSVKDSGIGLSKEQQNKLFQAFTQADTSTTRKYGGTGLGLSISKRLAELMGGSVGVEGELGLGSTFFFTISCKVLKTIISKSKINISTELLKSIRGASILLAEDNEINQQVAVELLETEGFFVDVADDGKIACGKIEQKEYDLVFMDLQMPNMNGFEATGRIRKELNKKELPIIAMTADAMTGIEEKVKDAGMDDYVTKPIDLNQLWKSLSQWIKPGDRELPEGYTKKDTPEDGEVFPDIEGIDTESGLKRVGNNSKLYRNLLKKFVEDYSDKTRTIAELFEKGKIEEAVRDAHTVKGVSANLGAQVLQNQMADIELKLNEGEDLKESLALTDEILSNLFLSIEESGVLSEETQVNTDKETITTDKLMSLLSDAVEALSMRKPKPAIEILDELEKYELSVSAKEQISQSSKFLAKYKMKEALAILNNMIESFT